MVAVTTCVIEVIVWIEVGRRTLFMHDNIGWHIMGRRWCLWCPCDNIWVETGATDCDGLTTIGVFATVGMILVAVVTWD